MKHTQKHELKIGFVAKKFAIEFEEPIIKRVKLWCYRRHFLVWTGLMIKLVVYRVYGGNVEFWDLIKHTAYSLFCSESLVNPSLLWFGVVLLVTLLFSLSPHRALPMLVPIVTTTGPSLAMVSPCLTARI